MWLATVDGFYSVIRWHDGRIAIRARQRSDVDRLRKLVPEVKFGRMQVTPRKDYRYRIFCTRDELEQHVMPAVARSVTYGNFKAAVDRRFGYKSAYSTACHAAWSVFEKMQPKGAYGSKSKGYPTVPKCEAKTQKAADAAFKPPSLDQFKARALAPLRDQDALFAEGVEIADGLECEDCGEELEPEDADIIGHRVYCRDIGECLSRASVRRRA